MTISEEIQGIPFEDHHVHAPEKVHQLETAGFRRPFTESAIPASWSGPLASQLGYRWMVKELAKVLGVDNDEATVIASRNAKDEQEYHRLLADAANLGDSYADYLFALDTSYRPEEWSELLGGRPVHKLLRVEVFVETVHEECSTLDEALDRLTFEIRNAASNGIVGLKSIAGYRVGLDIEAPTASQRRKAAISYAKFREEKASGVPTRIDDKVLVDTIVWSAFEAAAPLALPIQFHVAFGDDDIVLTKNDPSLMRALLKNEDFRTVPIVLLHCYPYHRTAGYLASLYPNVFVDLGLTIPIAGHGSARILAETLELTPVDQLLASTDGHMTPEFQWFGVHVWRWALEKVLGELTDDKIVDADESIAIARAIMHDNTRRIYPVE
ncbi:MAG: amidohydrolase family protein [Thermomicrobiales bacterium]